MVLKQDECLGYLSEEISGPLMFDTNGDQVYVGDSRQPDPYACSLPEDQPSGLPVLAIDPGCRQLGDSPNREFAPVRPSADSNGIPFGFQKQCSTTPNQEQELKAVLITPTTTQECKTGYRRWKTLFTPKGPANPCGPSMDHILENGIHFDEGEVGITGQVTYNPAATTDPFQFFVGALSPCGGRDGRFVPMKEFAALVASLIPTSGNPDNPATPDQVLVFHHNGDPTHFSGGTQQNFVVPAGAKSIDAEIWGAGGRGDGSNNAPFPAAGRGGLGGYTTFKTFAVTPGQIFSIVVGGSNDLLGTTPGGQNPIFGFAGQNSTDGHQSNGGGLSGIFTGPEPVTATDTLRAIAIAGGGGAGGATNPNQNLQRGGNGNDPSSGGMPSMQGYNGTNGQFTGFGAGGGGYSGGATSARNGLGGSGYVKAASVATYQTLYSAYNDQVPQGTTSANYTDNAAAPQQRGLVVITVRF